MSTYEIAATYYANTRSQITLPDDKTWDDVADWYVKWDIFRYLLKGTDIWLEIALNSGGMDIIDWKRPTDVTVFPVSEDGEADYDTETDSRG